MLNYMIIRKLLNISERRTPPHPPSGCTDIFVLIPPHIHTHTTHTPTFICIIKTAKTNSSCICLHVLPTKDRFHFQAVPSEGLCCCVVGGVPLQLANLSFRQLIRPTGVLRNRNCWQLLHYCSPTLSSVLLLAKSRWCELNDRPPHLDLAVCARTEEMPGVT